MSNNSVCPCDPTGQTFQTWAAGFSLGLGVIGILLSILFRALDKRALNKRNEIQETLQADIGNGIKVFDVARAILYSKIQLDILHESLSPREPAGGEPGEDAAARGTLNEK